MKLFYSPQTRGVIARWALEEVGCEYELVRLKFPEEVKRADHLAYNPLGQVPTLVDGEKVITECTAIALYLADRFPEAKLAPPLGERGEYYNWCFFMNATLEPPLMQVFLHTMRLPEEERLPERASKAQEELDRVFGVLQQRLEGREYVAGQTFSMADLLLGSTLGWIEKIGFLRNFPGLAEYARRTNARPACQRANAD
jgi:glutathione S-transferase